MNSFTATSLWFVGTLLMADILVPVPVTMVVRTAVMFFLSAMLGWLVFGNVRGANTDRDTKG